MTELANCDNCDAVFVKNIRDICQSCYKEEEIAFKKVYSFMCMRKNREAKIPEIVEATGVDEDLIIKFVRHNRLRASQFPNLSYPCEKCDEPIIQGKICEKCSSSLLNDLVYHEKIEDLAKENSLEKKEKSSVYYSVDTDRK